MIVVQSLAGVVLPTALFGLLLFLPAGTLAWPRAWWFLALVAALSVANTVSMMQGSRELYAERLRSPVQKGQPFLDKLIIIPFVLLFDAVIAFIPLDVFRFHLLPRPGALVAALGLAAFAGGWALIMAVLRTNAFAAPVVKHMTERGQVVVDTGLYAVVRHPMYAASIPVMVGAALWLQSYAAAVASVLPTALIVLRILVEERFLERELEGYAAYRQKVRWRLVPFVW